MTGKISWLRRRRAPGREKGLRRSLQRVRRFGVLPAYRGQGYGRAMLMDAVAMLAGEGWREMFLEVGTDNDPAVRLYRSSGFRVTSTYGFYELMY